MSEKSYFSDIFAFAKQNFRLTIVILINRALNSYGNNFARGFVNFHTAFDKRNFFDVGTGGCFGAAHSFNAAGGKGKSRSTGRD